MSSKMDLQFQMQILLMSHMWDRNSTLKQLHMHFIILMQHKWDSSSE
ncbi:unnamed protein product [Linum tenue]|uniref:Uncharacterized protein n=1 Tax=Linum tenue TaxID=586396 RepID=A0AAV0PT89_9ROSI|nr:unnamed protein product [Linum tenue]